MEKVHGTHRIDKNLVDEIKEMAKKEHRSFNNMLEIIVMAGVKSMKTKGNENV